jgi:hypothetical protein
MKGYTIWNRNISGHFRADTIDSSPPIAFDREVRDFLTEPGRNFKVAIPVFAKTNAHSLTSPSRQCQ